MDRYKGTKPFEDNKFDHLIFFGRDQEKTSLLNYILTENLVVLYAASGTGKTSLLNAGLMPLFRSKGFYPIVVRFKIITSGENKSGSPHDSETESPNNLIYSTIEKLSYKNGDIEVSVKEEQSLWNYFESSKFWIGDRSATPVIIFDQFEEFFQRDFPKDKTKQFVKDVADIVQGRHTSELNSLPKVKFIISLRQEFLFKLEELANQIPSIFRNRFRLTRLNHKQAYEAIVRPAALVNKEFNSPSFSYEEKLIKEILKLPIEDDRAIKEILTEESAARDTFQMQIICQSIEKTVTNTHEVKFKEIIEKGTINDILQNHYIQLLENVSLFERREVRKLCNHDLMSPDGHRVKTLNKRNINNKTLEKLERQGLLSSDTIDSVVYWELTHDNWIKHIQDYEVSNPVFFTKEKILPLFFGFGLGVTLVFLLYFFFLRSESVEFKLHNVETALRDGSVNEAIDILDVLMQKQGELSWTQKQRICELRIDALLKKNDYNSIFKFYIETPDSNTKSVTKVFRQLKEQRKESVSDQFKTIILNSSGGFDYWAEIGDYFLLNSEYNNCIKFYNKAVAKESSDSNLAMCYVKLGDAYSKRADLGLQDFSSAISKYVKALETRIFDNIGTADILDKIGLVFFARASYYSAISKFDSAIVLDPGNPKYYFHRGRGYLWAADIERSLEDFNNAIQKDSSIVDFFVSQGAAYLYSANKKLAYTSFKHASQIDTNNSRIYNFLGLTAELSPPEYDSAMFFYSRAIEFDPDYIVPKINKVNLLLKRKHAEEALKLIKDLVRFDDTNPEYLYYRGLAYLGLGRREDAKNDFETALKLKPYDYKVLTGINENLKLLK